MANMQTHNTRWQFERRQDIGGRFISIKGPDPVDGESPRSSAAVYESTSRDLYDLFGRIADEQAKQQVDQVESNATMPTTIPSDWQRVDYFCEQAVHVSGQWQVVFDSDIPNFIDAVDAEIKRGT